jgi:hypothetical protein
MNFDWQNENFRVWAVQPSAHATLALVALAKAASPLAKKP